MGVFFFFFINKFFVTYQKYVLHMSGGCMYVVHLATKEQSLKLLKHH